MSADIDVGKITEALNSKVDLVNGVPQDAVDYVVAMQRPTAENNYAWYRKYKSGWVEQGGIATINTNTAGAENNISLSIEMANTNYWVSALFAGAFGSRQLASKVSLNSTTYVCILAYSPGTESNSCYWQVSGISA